MDETRCQIKQWLERFFQICPSGRKRLRYFVRHIFLNYKKGNPRFSALRVSSANGLGGSAASREGIHQSS